MSTLSLIYFTPFETFAVRVEPLPLSAGRVFYNKFVCSIIEIGPRVQVDSRAAYCPLRCSSGRNPRYEEI